MPVKYQLQERPFCDFTLHEPFAPKLFVVTGIDLNRYNNEFDIDQSLSNEINEMFSEARYHYQMSQSAQLSMFEHESPCLHSRASHLTTEEY